MDSAEVASAIARGLQAGGLEVDRCPVADGGEGTLDALCAAFACERVRVEVSDPLGRPVAAEFGLGRGPGRRVVAVVETATASGLALLDAQERDPWVASTRGTGELIAAAVGAGAEVIYLGVGGSATTDGGAGRARRARGRGRAGPGPSDHPLRRAHRIRPGRGGLRSPEGRR